MYYSTFSSTVPAWLLIIAATMFGCRMTLPEPGGAPDDSASPPDLSEPSELTEDEIWEKLCEAATIDVVDYGDYQYTTAVFPIDLYCSLRDCDLTIDEYVGRFATCDEPESSWPSCAWKREQGCGTIQFEAPCDESCSPRVAYDQATGRFVGSLHTSDTSMNVCGAYSYRVGTFKDYFYKRECEDVDRTYCCNPD